MTGCPLCDWEGRVATIHDRTYVYHYHLTDVYGDKKVVDMCKEQYREQKTEYERFKEWLAGVFK